MCNVLPAHSSGAQGLWDTDILAALLGIVFFLGVVGAEKAIVRRAPEHSA